MQLHPTSRPRRVRRLIAVSAAAVAVMIAPTACDYGGAAQLDLPTHPGHTDGMNMDDRRRSTRSCPSPRPRHDPASAAADAETSERRRRPPRAAARGRAAPWRRPARARRRPPDDAATIPAPAGEATGTPAPAEPALPPSPAHRSPRTPPAPTAAPRPPAPTTAPAAAGANTVSTCSARDCTASNLPAHTGFQSAEAQCVNTVHGRGRPGGPAAVAADHRCAAVRAGRRAVQARGQHAQPGARPVPRRGGGRLLPGELVPQRRQPAARALPHRLPDPASTDRAPDSSEARSSSWPPRTTAAARRRTP